MPFDPTLADRIRDCLATEPGLTERKMFGGLCFMINGNMVCGVLEDDLIVRTGPERYNEALSRPYARKFDFTGKPMKGFVVAGPAGTEADEDLEAWVALGRSVALALPPKKKR